MSGQLRAGSDKQINIEKKAKPKVLSDLVFVDTNFHDTCI